MNKMKWITEHNNAHNNEYSNYVFTGKYLAIKKPSHPKSRSDGYVYIHQLQAEKRLGRYLKDSECVHHIDKNKYNNDIDNLMVFKTTSDHTAFHNGCDIALDGDVYIAINKKTFRVNNNLFKICSICKTNSCHFSSDMCIHCYSEKHKSKKKPDIDTLRNLILNYSFVSIGKMFDVSDNAVRKWCKSYGLPYKSRDVKLLKIAS